LKGLVKVTLAFADVQMLRIVRTYSLGQSISRACDTLCGKRPSREGDPSDLRQLHQTASIPLSAVSPWGT